MTVDCDLHVQPASIDALSPYLSDHWVNFIATGQLGLPSALAAMYPPIALSAPTPSTAAGLPVDDLAILSPVTGFDTIRNPYYAADLLRAVNDWQVAEFLDRDDRLRGSIVVTTLDVESAVAEIDRLGDDPRFVQVLLPLRTDQPLGNRRYHPIHAAAERHGLVVGLHAWGLSGTQPTPNGFADTYLEDYVQHTLIAQGQLTSLVVEGVFQRFPDLRVALLECGVAWLPAFLWRLDKDWKGIRREVPWVDRRPSHLLRDHLRVSVAPLHAPADLRPFAETLAMLDWPELLMYASDFPHDHGDDVARWLDTLPADRRAAVMGANAASHYRLTEKEPA